MEGQKSQGPPPINWNQVAPFGVIQIIEDQKVVDYGIGVIHKSDKLVTFQKYFNEHRTIGKIFFKKFSQDERFPISYDLNEENQANLIILNKEETQELQGNKFVNILLDSDFDRIPKFLPNNLINKIDSGKVGYAVGLDKSKGLNIILHKAKFELDSHIMDLRLKYKEAILFVLRQNKQYCYGFYEESGNGDQGNDLYLSDEFLELQDAQNEAFVQGHKEKQVQNPSQGVPFQSIGILRPPGGYGTAQLLKGKDGCKYLITCAHNFVGINQNGRYNYLDRLAGYSFELPKYQEQFKPLRYTMEKMNGFKIKAVYIPEEYTNYFKLPKFKNPKITKPEDKQIYFPQQGRIEVSINTLYDIAIIELKDIIKDVTHGFAIEEEKPIKYPVQVSGFPQGREKGKFFGIIEGNMYMESTASHPNDPSYVQLSNNSDGDILMLHKLSTLPGNSGSAIYERLSDKECRLLAIHTTGYGARNVNITQETKQKELLGIYNFGTYIHSKNIKSWLNSILNQ